MTSHLSNGSSKGPLLIYDSSCGFCARWIRRIQRWDKSGVVECMPLQDPKAVDVSGRSLDELRQAAHLVRSDGRVFSGATAARELFAYLPNGWVLRAIMRLPGVMPLANRTYRWIARRWGPVT